jgi:cytochrome oxidase Cu insertion factor (SCO1/SenC/PrrC family)
LTLDPWRDTPERLPSLAQRWALQAEDLLLSGSVSEVQETLDKLGIGRRRNEMTGDIDHSGTVLIVDARGTIAWRVDGDWSGVRLMLAGDAGNAFNKYF